MPNQKLTDAIIAARPQWTDRKPVTGGGGATVRPPGPVGGPPVRVPPNPKPVPPGPTGPPTPQPGPGDPPPTVPPIPPDTPPTGIPPGGIVVTPVGPPPTSEPGDFPTFHPGVWSDAKLTVIHGEGKYTVLKTVTKNGVTSVSENVYAWNGMNQDWLNSWLGDLRFADPINHRP